MGELTLISIVTAAAFFVKAITGFGGPLLAIPVLAPFLGVEHSIVALSLANLTSNVLLLVHNGSALPRVRPFLWRALSAGVVTVVAGTFVLVNVDDRLLLGALAVTVFLYIGVSVARPELTLSRALGLRLAVPVGVVGGFVHGATGNSGTVFGTYFHSLALTREQFVAAVSTVFLVLSGVQVSTLASLGSFGGGRLVQALAAVVPILVVTPFGTKLARRLDAKTFGRFVLAMLGFAGIRLVLGVFGV